MNPLETVQITSNPEVKQGKVRYGSQQVEDIVLHFKNGASMSLKGSLLQYDEISAWDTEFREVIVNYKKSSVAVKKSIFPYESVSQFDVVYSE